MGNEAAVRLAVGDKTRYSKLNNIFRNWYNPQDLEKGQMRNIVKQIKGKKQEKTHFFRIKRHIFYAVQNSAFFVLRNSAN